MAESLVNAFGLPRAVATVYGTPLPPGATPLTADDPVRIGEYRLMARLAGGGSGAGYAARGPRGGRVVVKAAVPRPTGGDRSRRAFAEAAGARMPAWYTARVLGHGNHAGLPYLAREYLEGITLAELVAEDGPLDPATLNSVAVALSAAISAIHDAGQVHGNLKPGNVVITLAGVRLLDHGLAPRSGRPRPTPDADVRQWARLVLFGGTAGAWEAGPANDPRGAADPVPDGAGAGAAALDEPLGSLVARALAAERAGSVCAARDILLGLVCPAADRGGRRVGWLRRRRGGG